MNPLKCFLLPFAGALLLATPPALAGSHLKVDIGLHHGPPIVRLHYAVRVGPRLVWVRGHRSWHRRYSRMIWVPGHWERPSPGGEGREFARGSYETTDRHDWYEQRREHGGHLRRDDDHGRGDD